MQGPPIRTSPRWSRSWPPLEFELGATWRLAAAWALWCLALAWALWIGCDLALWCRLALVALVLAMLWRGVRLLRSRGGRLCWDADGRWRHAAGANPGAYVQPGPPRRLGPILWLSWPAPGGRRYLSLDSACVEPKAWRAIKARMKFSGQLGHEKLP
jgi:hypothetical protein